MNYNLNDVVQQKIVYDIVLKGVNHIPTKRKVTKCRRVFISFRFWVKCAVGALIADEFYLACTLIMPCCNSSMERIRKPKSRDF